eukprot:365126-Chlamydomonas_euryale.AAC.57
MGGPRLRSQSASVGADAAASQHASLQHACTADAPHASDQVHAVPHKGSTASSQNDDGLHRTAVADVHEADPLDAQEEGAFEADSDEEQGIGAPLMTAQPKAASQQPRRRRHAPPKVPKLKSPFVAAVADQGAGGSSRRTLRRTGPSFSEVVLEAKARTDVAGESQQSTRVDALKRHMASIRRRVAAAQRVSRRVCCGDVRLRCTPAHCVQHACGLSSLLVLSRYLYACAASSPPRTNTHTHTHGVLHTRMRLFHSSHLRCLLRAAPCVLSTCMHVSENLNDPLKLVAPNTDLTRSIWGSLLVVSAANAQQSKCQR